MRKINLGVVLILLCNQISLAQSEFSDYIPNALAIGYGGSLVTYTDNPALIYWNPGGMAFATNDKILTNITNPFSFNYISFTKFFPPKNSLGFSLSKLVKNQDFIDVATIAYSRRLTRFFAVGGNVNYGSIDNNSDSFVTFGVGCLFKPAIYRYSFYQAELFPFSLLISPSLYDKLALGIMIHNIPINKTSASHVIRIGSALKLSKSGPSINFDYHIRHRKNSAHFGTGFNISSIFHFFAGLADFNIKDLAFGGSISLGLFSTDIIYSTRTEKISMSVSLRINDNTASLAKKYSDQGMKKIKENNFRSALAEFKKSLSYNQKNERIIYLTNVLQKRIAKENNKIDSLLYEATKFQKKRWYINATLTYKKILEIDKNNKKALKSINSLKPYLDKYIDKLSKKGITYFNNNELNKAETMLKEILLVDENHPVAIKYLAKIDSVNSYFSNEYYYRGLGYYKQRRLEKAKAAFDRVLELNPNHKEAKYYVNIIDKEIRSNKRTIEKLLDEAHLLERQGRYVSASSKYREILNIDRDFVKAVKQLELLQEYISSIASRKFKKAKKLFKKGNYQEAQAIVEDILSMQPSHKQAKYYLRRIRDVRSDQAKERYQLAKQYFDDNKWDDALKECEQALDINPNYSDAQKLHQGILANISLKKLQGKALRLFNKGDYLNALKVFNKMISIDPDHVIAKSYINECQVKLNKRIVKLFNSGMTFYTSGNYEAAIREWDRILKIDPNNRSAIEYKKRARERLEALKKLP